jgi:conjugative relaxase-like TrwC/TraI family protein
VLTISKLKRWSINYYIDTAQAAENATKDRARSGGGLGEYYSERETRTPIWLLAGDTHTVARLVGLTDAERVGGDADAPAVVARWLDDGIAPNGAHGRAFGERGVHGFDLTFCAPKSVSLVRALRADDVMAKAIADAHTTALAEVMEYLTDHAGYTRVHNPHTGEKDLVRLPGLAAIAYQHETSRCGDPHLHTHVIVPNRQARADGQLVSVDGTSLYHEARAAGVIYQATLRRELHQSMGLEWAPVDPSTGMAELAGVDRDTITAWSRRSSQLREWAAHLYERSVGESEYGHHEPDDTHLTSRGTSRDAAGLIRAILTNHDQTPITAHDYDAQTPGAALPARVRSLLNRRTTAAHRRRATYETWRAAAEHHAQSMGRARERATSKSRDRTPDSGIEL